MKKIIFLIAVIILSSIGSLFAGTVILENYQNGHSGDLYAGTWNIRDKFSKTYDDDNLCTLYNDGLFKLKAGVYLVYGWAFGYMVDTHQTRLMNLTKDLIMVLGTSSVSNSIKGSSQTKSIIDGVFTLTSDNILQFQHKCQTTKLGNGKGQNSNFGHGERFAFLKFKKLKDADITSENVVMLGDSIIAYCDWSKLLGSNVLNYGVAGDTTDKILSRLHQVIAKKPQKVFIMAGINDIRLQKATPSQVFKNYKSIIDQCIDNGIIVYVLSTLYTTDTDKNVIDNLDSMLSSYCSQRNLKYINLNKVLFSKNIVTNTIDGIHPNAEGYSLWINEIITDIHG